MASDEVERLLRDIRADQVVPVHYAKKSLSARVVLLIAAVIRAVLGRW
jgi:L-ascorbate metabolism protein UlaG (beta-lactamase superfamily)